MADYKVAVELSLVGGIFTALTLVSRHLSGLHQQQKNINTGFLTWKGSLLLATGALIGAGGLLEGMNSVLKASDALLNKYGQLKQAGHSLAEIEKARAAGISISNQFKDMTVSQGVGLYQDILVGAGGKEESLAFMPDMARMGTILKSINPSIDRSEQVKSIMRMLEQLGLLGTGRDAEAHKLVENIVKDFQGTQGRVTPERLASAIMYARSAKYSWASPEALADPNAFIWSYLPHLIQEFGGSAAGGVRGPGNALMTEFSKVNQQILSKKSRAKLGEYDLLEQDEKGHEVVKGAKQHALSPYAWIQEVLMPALAAKGVTGKDEISNIVTEISKMMGVRTAADAMTAMALQGSYRLGEHSPFEKSKRLQQGSQGGEAGLETAKSMPTYVEDALGSSWKRMWEMITESVNPERLEVLKKITNIFSEIGNIASHAENAEKIKGMSHALLGLAAGLAALGTAAIIGALASLAGPGGLLFALGAAIAGMSPKVRAALDDLLVALADFNTAKVKAAAKKLGMAVMDAIADALIEVATAPIRAADRLARSMDKSMHHYLPDLGVGKEGVPPLSWRMQHGHDRSRLNDLPIMPKLNPGIPGGLQPYTPPASPLPGDWKYNSTPGFPSPQSFLPSGGASPLLHHASDFSPSSGGGGLMGGGGWEPRGGGPQTISINNVIHLDGSAIARAVNEYQVAGLEHPVQAPMFDGRANYTPPDWSPISA